MKQFPAKLRHGVERALVLDRERLVVFFKRSRTPAQVEPAANKAGFTCECFARADLPEDRRHFMLINDNDRCCWLRNKESKPISAQKYDALRKRMGRALAFTAPVYRVAGTVGEGGLVCPLPSALLIKPAENISPARLARLLRALSKMGLREEPGKSKYLGGYRYFRVSDPNRQTAYALRERIMKRLGSDVADSKFENMPMVKPVTFVPNDPFFGQQWNLGRVRAPVAWDTTVGLPALTVAMLDQGCDLTHPDITYASSGINLGSMSGTGAPTGPHGTACAGIAAARINNSAGVAGLAGGCKILPIAFQFSTDVECAAGIRFAAQNGADVISMSFGVYGPGEGLSPTGWNFSLIDPAIEEAVAAGLVLCAATGNENVGTFNRYPSRHPLVMACGGTSTDDNRKTTTSPDGECWGANFANGVSVVAPCVTIPTTDIQGSGGYNNNSGGSKTQVCMSYASSGDAAGNYFILFDGTSAATPHLAALAALVFSANPLIVNHDVRDLIEKTAAKVGSVPYAVQSGFPNGSRNQQMGYGRIDAGRATETAGLLFVRQFSEFFNP